jgi:DNA repair protein RadD
MKLRPYQEDVVSKIMWAKDLPGNDVICVAQGGGKSVIIAETANRLGRVLVICPNKEILEQDVDKMTHYVERDDIGVFSASMNEKTIKRITFGTIQSMYKHPELFKEFDIVIYDECDLHNPKKMGMSTKLFEQAGISKVFGFTGTPFRQDIMYKRWGSQKWMVEAITTTKMINRMAPIFWKRMLCVINTQDLLEQGYLTPLKYHDVSLYAHEEIPTNKSKSDFDMVKFEKMIEDRLQTIADYIIKLEHKAKLVFCATIDQANELQGLISGSVVVTSETSKKERERIVRELKEGKISVVLNVGIFTVGFDYPELDCLVLLRPTRSLRLHCQILGRASRIAEGKEFGHVYDLVGNVKALGQLADIVVKKGYDGKWNVMGGMFPNGFHGAPLYSHKLQKPKPKQGESEIL